MKVCLYLVLLLTLGSAFAEVKGVQEHKTLNFKVDTSPLLKGELHYSFEVLSPANVTKKYPDLADVDSLGILKKKDASILLSKAAYVIRKPVGFFDQQTAESQAYASHLLGTRSVRKLKDSFDVEVPGQPPLKFRLRNHYDSDDITTVHHSRAVKAVTAIKKLDVLLQSSSSIIFQEMSEFNIEAYGGLIITGHIPLMENRTLVVTFKMFSLRDYATDAKLKPDTVAEYLETRKLIESYRAD